MAIRSRIGFLIPVSAALCGLFLAGCRAVIPAPGSLTVEGAARSADDAANGFLTTVDCSPLVDGQHATECNARSYASIPLLNAGSAEVVITGVELILLDSNGAPSTHAQSYFTWAGQAPDVPLTLAVGKKAVFNVAFSSSTAGVFYGCLNVITSDGCQQVRLTGEAGWPITLTVTNSTNNYGQITAPVTVTKGQSIVYLCAGSTLTLTAGSTDPVQLTELKTWSCAGNASIPGTANALTITATITGAASINADFDVMYRLLAAGGDLVAEVAALKTDVTKKGIALQVGAYSLTGDVVLPQCLVRGGYAVGWGSRAYTGTLINTQGHDFKFSGSAITSDALLEGVQVTAANDTTGLYAAFGVENGAAPTLRYCTFVGGGGAATNSIGLYIYNSSPTVDNCVIKGSDTTAAGGRSVGLWTTYSGAPTVTNCTISAGKASASDGKTYGVLNSSFASSPIIQGCTIDGGTGTAFTAAFWTGEGGRPRIEKNTLSTRNAATSNYGVYIYSNGRLETLFGNNIYNCSSALVYDYPHDQKAYTSIDDVNTDFISGDQEANTSAP